MLPMTETAKRTPAMQQYDAIKAQHPDGFLFFQMGDFFELFGEDAVRASKILGLTLTARDKHSENPMPFAGMPIHAGERYISELTRQGHKVVVCEQMTPTTKKGVIERAVTRIVTPGTTLSGSVLAAKELNVILAITEDKGHFAVAWADSSTGSFWTRHCSTLDSLSGLLSRLAPKEVLLAPRLFSRDAVETLLSQTEVGVSFSYTAPEDALTKHFGVHTLASFGLEREPQLHEAANMVLAYIIGTQMKQPAHITRVLVEQENASMQLDWQTIRNLELFATAREGQREGSLVDVLDETCTAMGGRYLRQALLFPLKDVAALRQRLAATEALTQKPTLLRELRQHLDQVHDIERLLGRLSLGRGNARDMVALRNSIEQSIYILQASGDAVENAATLQYSIPSLEELKTLLAKALLDDPKPILNEGGMIREGYNVELDELHHLQRDARSLLIDYQTREQERTNIPLKVKSTGVFGYFIEVSKSHLAKVPPDYIRKQSLVGAERFTTPELKELEDRILHADERIMVLELRIFEELRTVVLEALSVLQPLALFLAELDFLCGNAACALARAYICPILTEDQTLHIEDGRHPVVEALLQKSGQSFVANDTRMQEERLHLITGPNMAGKSTYLRQVALICHMAHCGMFVPAKAATIPLLDRIFTRIGAQDNLARGQSTFMVEMQETAHILHYATDRSLIILDEIGRGTSTYDGLSIAWALMEHLHERGSMTLFATHYHELIAAVEKLPQATNFSVAVSEQGTGIIFLHSIVPGGAPDSYGIAVAALAGIPKEVLTSAKEHLAVLESGEKAVKPKRQPDPNQLSFLSIPATPTKNPNEEEILRHIRDLDPDRMSPREAQDFLYTLKDLSH